MHNTLDLEKQAEVDLVKKFNQCANDPDILREYDELFCQKKNGMRSNFLMQRRVQITPTVVKFSRAQEEESNRVIRKFKAFLPNFVRLSFVGEDGTKGYYFGDNKGFILGHIH